MAQQYYRWHSKLKARCRHETQQEQQTLAGEESKHRVQFTTHNFSDSTMNEFSYSTIDDFYYSSKLYQAFLSNGSAMQARDAAGVDAGHGGRVGAKVNLIRIGYQHNFLTRRNSSDIIYSGFSLSELKARCRHETQQVSTLASELDLRTTL